MRPGLIAASILLCCAAFGIALLAHRANKTAEALTPPAAATGGASMEGAVTLLERIPTKQASGVPALSRTSITPGPSEGLDEKTFKRALAATANLRDLLDKAYELRLQLSGLSKDALAQRFAEGQYELLPPDEYRVAVMQVARDVHGGGRLAIEAFKIANGNCMKTTLPEGQFPEAYAVKQHTSSIVRLECYQTLRQWCLPIHPP